MNNNKICEEIAKILIPPVEVDNIGKIVFGNQYYLESLLKDLVKRIKIEILMEQED